METRVPRTLDGHDLVVHVAKSAHEAAGAVAATLADLVGARRRVVLGLATGHTPLPVYAELARRVAAGGLSLAGVTTFNLDEYVGLAPGHRASFAAYMRRCLVEASDIGPGRVHLPRGDAADPEAEATRYERAVREAGGVELQLLGVGANGHIGFNEPGSPRDSRTRVVRLSGETRAANAPDFPEGEPVPARAITMGVATILEARRVVVLATGPKKADAVRRMLAGPIDASCPASFLRTHPAAEVWLDEAAAAELG